MRIIIILLITLGLSLGLVQGQNNTSTNAGLPCEKYLISYTNSYNIELVQSVNLLRDAVTHLRIDSLNVLPNTHLLKINRNKNQLMAKEIYIIDCYNKTISSNPNNEQLWLGLGDFYATLATYRGDIYRDKALKCYENAVTKNFSNIEPLLKKARHYYKYCAEEKAIEICDNVLLVDTESWEAWYIKGIAYNNLNKYDDAINSFNESLKINESNSDALSGIASALVGVIFRKINEEHWLNHYEQDTSMIKSNFIEAEKCLEKSMNLSNESKSYLIGKGDYYYAYGTYHKKLLPLYQYDSNNYNKISNITRDSYSIAWISYTDALLLDPSDCRIWKKEQNVLGTQGNKYTAAINYAAIMAQKLGYIS